VEDKYCITLEEQEEEEQQNKPHYEIVQQSLAQQVKLHLIFLLVIATPVADNTK